VSHFVVGIPLVYVGGVMLGFCAGADHGMKPVAERVRETRQRRRRGEVPIRLVVASAEIDFLLARGYSRPSEITLKERGSGRWGSRSSRNARSGLRSARGTGFLGSGKQRG
jgi:hypothetical protein